MRLIFKRKTSRKEISRRKKKVRVRQTLIGTAERPRLTVFKSLTALYAQIVDDSSGRTLVAISTKQLGEKAGKNLEGAKQLGAAVAKAAVDKKIEKVVFDRNGYLFHGRVKTVAESARGAGLKF